ncbi:hypothetical protein Lesp02_44250 [Lentzea sp. NBRC 105346]|uniref:hypothetical protein n=1 Tax=Lentzea sp. NBRC 105346 TaxID=3032205 RepID=UPI0024A3279F|nr:hypothetical protein [Lentzea sp. NBRC 105346]GLZ32237.1 hypothetical protein Lesp02_44250 [Lentzea sp. NBRC 105346]
MVRKVVVLVMTFMAVLTAAPAMADSVPEQRVDQNVRIWRQYTASGYRIWAEARYFAFWGHYDLWGPNLNAKDPAGEDTHWEVGEDTRPFGAWGSGWACARGWAFYDGAYHSMGEACIPV